MGEATKADERKCVFCGDGEEDSNLTYCHECDRTICVDNCVACSNEEHGLDFCWQCVDEGKVEIVDEDEEDSDEY
jgi:hypothetical protein